MNERSNSKVGYRQTSDSSADMRTVPIWWSPPPGPSSVQVLQPLWHRNSRESLFAPDSSIDTSRSHATDSIVVIFCA